MVTRYFFFSPTQSCFEVNSFPHCVKDILKNFNRTPADLLKLCICAYVPSVNLSVILFPLVKRLFSLLSFRHFLTFSVKFSNLAFYIANGCANL